MRVRPATAADIPSMMDLEQASETAAHWTGQQYRRALQPGEGSGERLVLLAEEAAPGAVSRILGFLVARHVAREWELENIVVAPSARRRKLGTQLLEGLLAAARKTNSEAVFLEVRESNAAARSLYEGTGFQQTGRRKSYYADPLEDAILYRRRVD